MKKCKEWVEKARGRGEKLFWQIKLKYFTLYSQLSSQIFLRYLKFSNMLPYAGIKYILLSHLIMFWKAVVVETGKDKCFVKGLTVGDLPHKSCCQWRWKSGPKLSPVWRRMSHWRKDSVFFCELLSQISASCRALGTPANFSGIKLDCLIYAKIFMVNLTLLGFLNIPHTGTKIQM